LSTRTVITSPRRAAIVMPIGPGVAKTLDTLASVKSYCIEPHTVVVVDDNTKDGTHEGLLARGQAHWQILRNERVLGRLRQVHSLCRAYEFVLSETDCDLALRLDQDALLIKPGVISDARDYAKANPSVGLFGVYAHDYNRPRSFESHARQITKELGRLRKLLGLRPSWAGLLASAEQRGYRRGDNVFGGAYFVTRSCLSALKNIGALDVPYCWHSRLMEDVYFSMASVAAGFKLGHFAAPDGPLCLEWNGLPYPAKNFVNSPYKVIHSVDKGKNTNRDANDGKTVREFFQIIRGNEAT
jgi:hypothetical protein